MVLSGMPSGKRANARDSSSLGAARVAAAAAPILSANWRRDTREVDMAASFERIGGDYASRCPRAQDRCETTGRRQQNGKLGVRNRAAQRRKKPWHAHASDRREKGRRPGEGGLPRSAPRDSRRTASGSRLLNCSTGIAHTSASKK